MISKESEAAIFVGDFDYEDSPETWQNFTSMYLPENFPLFSLIGNHDSDNWYGASGYQSYINERINRLNLKCMGEVGMTQVCSYKGIMMFLSGAGSFKNKQDFAKINDVAQQMLGGIFNIAAWHGNMCNYTVGSIDRGNFADYTGWEIFEKARENGAMIFNGHDHAYARTKVLANIEQSILIPNNQEKLLPLKKGQTNIVVVGTGGKTLYRCDEQKIKNYWWQRYYCRDSSPTFKTGVVFCKFNYNGQKINLIVF